MQRLSFSLVTIASAALALMLHTHAALATTSSTPTVAPLTTTSTTLTSSSASQAANTCRYTVQPGDWLSRIAAQYGMAWQTLYALNRQIIGDNPNMIYVGEQLILCGYPHDPVTPPTPTRPTPPAPAPTTPPAPTGNVPAMIQQIFGANAPQALVIARCESGFDPNAWNGISIMGSHAEGVFQILYPSTWDSTSYRSANPYNAWTNILAAHEIFARDGYSWREWQCRA